MALERTPHLFHIPIMGTGFTIDTALKVAKYGISSVVSLVDDTLIEQMRKFHCEKNNEPYEEIKERDEDARARRITAYLNLLDRLVQKQVRALQASPFEEGSEITHYYEMLPDTPLKQLYKEMLATQDSTQKIELQERLRKLATPGSIDVNILTKLDRDRYDDEDNLLADSSDALAGLRGYANSTLSSSIVFSAGFNPRLYNYIPTFDDFLPDANGYLKKRITLKVNDYRSALIQGKYLAKHGLWVSEYRVESGLNCGGHAFGNDGYLMGPILEEFKEKKQELIETLHGFYNKALKSRKNISVEKPHKIYITVQGGIGTYSEHMFLLEKYELDATGWGTPFLLVPEAVNVDDEHLQKLMAATEKDVYLSDISPLNVPFWNLATSKSEEVRRGRIELDRPGSPCPKGYVRFNTEFKKSPLCIASRAYQRIKLKALSKEGKQDTHAVTAKACICHDLAGNATKKYGIDVKAISSICPGPNIVNFSKIASLEDMVNHIYGRISLLTNSERPHMFIKELKLQIEVFKNETEKSLLGLASQTQEKLQKIKDNLNGGIEYYQNLGQSLLAEQQESFLKHLNALTETLQCISLTSSKVSESV